MPEFPSVSQEFVFMMRFQCARSKQISNFVPYCKHYPLSVWPRGCPSQNRSTVSFPTFIFFPVMAYWLINIPGL